MSDVVERLEGFAKAYPKDIFPEVGTAERAWLAHERPGMQDRIAGSIGRHFAKFASEAATEIARLRAELAKAEELRRVAEALSVRNDDQFEELTARAEAAEARALAAEARMGEVVKALDLNHAARMMQRDHRATGTEEEIEATLAAAIRSKT